MATQEKKDAVTVGQIRTRINGQLDSEIDTLSKLIRQGYFNLPKAETYLKETIGRTLTTLQNLDAMASTEAVLAERP